MKYLKSVFLTLFIVITVLNTSPTLQTKICYGDNPPLPIVDNLYSSVVLITNKKLKTSALDALRFAAFIAGQVAGTGSYGIGSYKPVHTEKTIGTGFQTKWGVVTNSHVMDNKPKAVLTTFYKSSYRIKKISKIDCYNNKHVSLYNAKMAKTTTKEITVYDWGMNGLDLALISIKIPGAFVLPLAKEVKQGDKVFMLGHPNGKQFTPALGSIEHIYERGGTKYIELFIENAPGCSGSPVMNTKGEVVGIIWGSYNELTAEAIHVEELRKAIGLPIYNATSKKHLPAIEPWNGIVYSTEYSRLFHHPDCIKLRDKDGDLITFMSTEDAMKNGGKPCTECVP